MYPKQRLHHNYLLSFATSKLTSDFFICPKPCRGFAEAAGQSIIHDGDCGESSPWRKLGKKKQFLQQQDTPQPSSAGNVSTHRRASKQRDGEEARVNIVLFRINEKAQGLGQWEARLPLPFFFGHFLVRVEHGCPSQRLSALISREHHGACDEKNMQQKNMQHATHQTMTRIDMDRASRFTFTWSSGCIIFDTNGVPYGRP